MSAEYRNMTPSSRSLRQAIAWCIRLQYADFTTRLHERWETWIDIPENQCAFQVIEELWSQLDQPRHPRHVKRSSTSQPPKPSKGLTALRLPRAIWITTTTAILAIGAVAFYSKAAPATMRFQMQVHSQKSKPLAPASAAKSSPPPEIEVEVARGKAVFRGADDLQRRYIVTTDVARIEGTGTEFSVSNTEQSVVVTVSAGAVEISPRTLGKPTTAMPITLRKDQQLTLPKNGSASTLQKIAHANRGRLIDKPWL